MTEVGPRVSSAHRTATRLVEWTLVLDELCVLDVQLAARRERLSGATIARRSNAVEHVDPGSHSLDQILWGTNTHQVARRVWRHSWRDVFNHVKHHRLLFPDAQTADGVTIEADVYCLFETVSAQLEMTGALDDAEERLCAAQTIDFETAGVGAFRLKSIESFSRALCPTRGEVQAALSLLVSRLAGRTFVEDHDDV